MHACVCVYVMSVSLCFVSDPGSYKMGCHK